MHEHQLTTMIGSTAAAVVIVVLAGVPFLRMLPLLLILGGPLVAVLAMRATGILEAPTADDEARPGPAPHRSQLQHH